jgi:hypothetical protein
LQLKPALRGRKGGGKMVSEPWPDADRDFAGSPIRPGDVGAYARTVSAPWAPNISIKPMVKPLPGPALQMDSGMSAMGVGNRPELSESEGVVSSSGGALQALLLP